MQNFYNPKSIVTLDITDINTGEIYETIEGIWGGDVKKVIAEISERYNVVKVERSKYHSNLKTVWVEA